MSLIRTMNRRLARLSVDATPEAAKAAQKKPATKRKRAKGARPAASYRAALRAAAIKDGKHSRRLVREAAIARRVPAEKSPEWQRVSPPRYPQKVA